MNKICIYAICKNEAKFVDKWVESMKEADCIVVLDTGSTDDTLEKFSKYPFVIVKQKTYETFRFDEARNDAIKLVPEDCNILFSTDLDEILEPGWAKPLREKWIEGVHERASYKYAWSHLSNGANGRIFEYNKIHSRNWIWEHPVHESLYNYKTKTSQYDYSVSLDLFNDIFLHHYPDSTKSRGSYFDLLKLRVKETPDDCYGMIYLAHECYYRKLYDECITTINKILEKFPDRLNSIEKASCYLFKGDSYAGIDTEKSIKLAKQCYLDAIKIDSTYREPYINLAKIYQFKLNDNEKTIEILKEALVKTHRHYSWLERDLSWTYELWDILSLASYYSGNKLESLAYALKALTFDTTNERLKSNLDIILKTSKDNELI